MRRLTSPLSARQHLLAARAHGLRKAPTLSEQKLWAALSGGKLGVAFRRQVPVGHRFIVDFFSPSLKLVVAVDGSAHERKRRADARRDDALRKLGCRVMRVDAQDVVRDLSAVVARLQAVVVGALRR